MNVTSISDFRKNAKQYFDQVNQDQDILIIARSNGQSVVVMPIERFNSMTETEYLLSNPVNAVRLKKSFKDATEGKVVKRKLIDA